MARTQSAPTGEHQRARAGAQERACAHHRPRAPRQLTASAGHSADVLRLSSLNH